MKTGVEMRRARVHLALRAIEDGTRLDELTDDEIDTIINAARDYRQTHPAATGSVRELPTDRYGETALNRISDHAENGTMPPQFREDLRALLALAAAPTPDAAASDAAVPAGEDDGEDERPLTAKERAMIDAAWEHHKTARPCTIPPAGWRCTRTGGHDGPCAAVPAAAPKVASDTDAAASEAGEVSDLAWLSGQHRLSLQFHSPMYGDDDDQSQEWRVDKESGPINDREWDTVGRGFTAAEAIAAARAALTTRGGAEG